MSRLRKKLGPYGDGTERIHTVRSEGYVYVFPGEDGRAGKADAS
jgi:two-component system response regulator CpxR